MPFKELPRDPQFPKLEEDILSFWGKEKIFAKSLKKTKDRPPFVFYEGPPTTNGKPHIGHVLTRIFKDVVPRYKTMQGYYVLRKGGWDTHGLPVEIEVEKELGISGKQEIENIVQGDPEKSIAKFNELCKRSGEKYRKLWEKMIWRVGHWIDLEHAYLTYEKSYIESIWWAFQEYWKKGLLYRGNKVVPYCTRCGTPLSSHEVAQGYEEVEDASIYVRFPLMGEKETALLVWTTTPWTLPGNVALAVDPNEEYVKVREKEKEGERERERYVIVAKDLAKTLGLTEVVKTIKGADLVGKRYHPLYPWLRSLIPREGQAFQVVPADFVSMEEGTGIVHTAVMYGEEDFALGQKLGLPQRHLVDKNGRFFQQAGWLAGKYVKDADPLIIHDLKARNLIFKEERIRHQYPFCWRCHRPLLYYALESWFIKTTEVKELLQKNNRSVNWVPEYVGRGRMEHWYETLVDWSISRTRYWGTPLPAWICDKNHDHITVIGSYDELAKKVGKRLPADFDPHRPFIDRYTWACSKKDGGTMRRTPEVTDVWHDAGSMPFAQWHYPLENKEMIDPPSSASGGLRGAGRGKQFPADYISEAIDQTRGWFYTLQAISTLLTGKTPYKNVVVFEHVLDAQGRKMSKHLGNVVDPWESLETIGADPVRWFFLTSVAIGTHYRASLDGFRETVRRFFLPLIHSVSFFVTYANLDRWEPATTPNVDRPHILDRWIIARLHELVGQVTKSLDAYDFPLAGRAIQDFVVNDLSTWYIRRSRDRVGQDADPVGRAAFYTTMYQVLQTTAQLLAPMTPFVAEVIFRTLRRTSDPSSVHLTDWPQPGRVDRKLLDLMTRARLVVEEGMRQRKDKGIRVRQPLSHIRIAGVGKWPEELTAVVADELNVKEVRFEKGRKFHVSLDTKLTPALKEEGTVRELTRAIQGLRKQGGYKLTDQVRVAIISADSLLAQIVDRERERIEKATNTRFAAIEKPEAEATMGSATIQLAK